MVLTETFLDDRGWQRGQRLCEQLLFDARHVGDRADRAGPARLGGARRREDRSLHPGAGGSGSAIRGSSSAHLPAGRRSEEHTSELQSRGHLVCRLLLEKKKKNIRDLIPSKTHV